MPNEEPELNAPELNAPDPVQAPPAVVPPAITPPPRAGWLGWTILGVAMAAVAVGAIVHLVRESRRIPAPPPLWAAPPFNLTDHTGRPFASADKLAGKAYLADFIFTRCGGQCPLMTTNMKKLRTWLDANGHQDMMCVSMTVDPDFDTTTVLSGYADRFKIDTARWTFLTGPRDVTYPLIRDGFRLGVVDNQKQSANPGEDFIHSDKFVLVDRKGQVRGYFSGYNDYEADIEKLKRTIEAIAREEAGK